MRFSNEIRDRLKWCRFPTILSSSANDVAYKGYQLTIAPFQAVDPDSVLGHRIIYQSPSAARGLRYRKWPFGMASEVFWRSGDARKVFWRSGEGAGVGGFGGSPPFEDVTNTPGAGVGGFGGSPPIRGCDIHPWRGSGGSVATLIFLG